ncbi:hypothetical protein MG293_010101 [Ovis ammon polii]|uniref:Uncharacterized protein n=1 Tax=Ovis ammon polii TaxID=230172 RepID=A0AAD4U5P1_OVIAM|nr:hypothetical protein MG293_010101 [Ovis ammon polii]KAI4565849.1 hypothetical protein MJT46_009224 [Ovis ammon polii x Ovis aries]
MRIHTSACSTQVIKVISPVAPLLSIFCICFGTSCQHWLPGLLCCLLTNHPTPGQVSQVDSLPLSYLGNPYKVLPPTIQQRKLHQSDLKMGNGFEYFPKDDIQIATSI